MSETTTTDEAPTQRRELMAVPPQAGGRVMAFIPQTPEEIKWTIGMVVGAGLAPNSYGGDQKKMAIGIMKGLEVGLPPITALEWIAVINGRPTIWGDGAISLVHASGHLAGYEETEVGDKPGDDAELDGFADDYGFEVRMTRRSVDGPFIGRFTVGDAKRAKLWMNPRRDPWMKYPKRMLRMRAAGFAIRNGFADCLAGMMIREEVEDLPMPAPERKDTSFLDGDAPQEELTHDEAPPQKPEPDVLDDPAPPYAAKRDKIMESIANAEAPDAIDSLLTTAFGPDIEAMPPAVAAEIQQAAAARKAEFSEQVA